MKRERISFETVILQFSWYENCAHFNIHIAKTRMSMHALDTFSLN